MSAWFTRHTIWNVVGVICLKNNLVSHIYVMPYNLQSTFMYLSHQRQAGVQSGLTMELMGLRL